MIVNEARVAVLTTDVSGTGFPVAGRRCRNVADAKRTAKRWIADNLAAWPGLRAAHFVGGITTMADAERFQLEKDIDLHLIFAEGSPIPPTDSPFMNIIEADYASLLVEAGVRSEQEYASPEAVLANPEIAHHLTRDSIAYDPDGWLRGLQERVRREYPRRKWVRARIAHEREGLAGALALLPMARGMTGASGEVNILGYTFTYMAALLAVASLRAPRIGSRMFLHLRDGLAGCGRRDLYEEVLTVLGLQGMCPAQVEQALAEGAEAFDLAVQVRQTPHPFQHKLQAHLRPYFVAACRNMLDAGHHREALGWLLPFYLSSTDVIVADAVEAEKRRFAARQAGFLEALGMATAEARGARFAHAERLYQRFFALADEIVAAHPGIID
jgi:hypothetical protein